MNSMKYTDLPANGCELRDVSFHELSTETRGGGWVVVSSYITKWKDVVNYTEKEGEGMRYLIARVNEAPEIARHIKAYDEANTARYKAEAEKRTVEEELKKVQAHTASLYREIATLQEEKLLRDAPGADVAPLAELPEQ